MKKKVMVFMLVFTMCLCSFTSLSAYAANSDGESTTENTNLYGRKVSAGESIEVDFTGGLGDYYFCSYEVLSGSIYVIAFLDRDDDGFSVLAYSDSPFSVRVANGYGGLNNDGTEYKNTTYGPKVYSFDGTYIKKDTASGLYYTGTSSSAGNECISTVPVYWLDDGESSVDFLSQLADGTFEEENEDDFIGGTEAPDFNQDDADYNQDLGYLKGIRRHSKTIGINDDGSASADFLSFEQRISFDKLSTTDFDLTMGNSFIRVFVTPAVYDKSGKEILNCSTRYFVNQYPSKDLTFNITEEELDLAAKEVWDEADTLGFRWNEMINKYRRNDTLWLQIVNYDGEKWQYGGYVKLKGSYDGDFSGSAETPSGEEDNYDEDVENTEGTGGTSEDADDDINPIHPNDSFTDFESMLDALTHGLMDFPELVGKVFSFLPKEFEGILMAGLSCVIVLRILGR